jgi:hypothetical protein
MLSVRNDIPQQAHGGGDSYPRLTSPAHPLIPGRSSIIEITPEHIHVTTIKKALDRNSIIVRLYNPFRTSLHVSIRGGLLSFTNAHKCLLSEERDSVLPVTCDNGENTTKFVVGGKKIVTVELVLNFDESSGVSKKGIC